VEVFAFETLQLAYQEAVDPLDREHLTRFIVKQIPERFTSGFIEDEGLASQNLGEERWCVDYEEDLLFVQAPRPPGLPSTLPCA
jgi:spore coat polysaccharide biosynthesis protein SpsF (cytidylyltransferase family)